MKLPFSTRATSRGAGAVLALLASTSSLLPAVTAHSWVEQVMLLATNGTMVGSPGFVSGAVARGSPGFNDDVFVNLVPPNGRAEGPVVLPSDKMCKSFDDYSNSALPRLTASPGDFIALRHLENGHVSLPDGQPNKPLNRGTIYIYGTTEPRDDDTILAIHGVWNKDQTGGDRRGRLLATRSFDDGQCYEANPSEISQSRQSTFKKDARDPMGVNLWCQADMALPADLPTTGTLTFYWLWDWPTLDPEKVDMQATKQGKFPSSLDGPNSASGVHTPQIYTSCGQIQLAPRGSNNVGAKGAGVSAAGIIDDAVGAVVGAVTKLVVDFTNGQDLNFAGIKSQMEGNNFDLPPLSRVPGDGNGEGDSGASPSVSSSTRNRAPTATTSSTLSTVTPDSPRRTRGPGRGDRIKTVTVTVPATTLTTTRTVTADVAGRPTQTIPAESPAATTIASAPTQTNAGGRPLVTPFLHRRGTGLRGRAVGAWGFGGH